MTNRRRILFVCSGNACRSPMAEALANARFGASMEAESAGVKHEPGPAHPMAIATLRDLYGIDLTAHRSRSTADIDLSSFDSVVALSPTAAQHDDLAGLGAKLVSWTIPDPWNKPVEVYAQTAEAILALLSELDSGITSATEATS